MLPLSNDHHLHSHIFPCNLFFYAYVFIYKPEIMLSIALSFAFLKNLLFLLLCYIQFLFLNLYVFLFFKYQFIYFNWRLISLQYCTGFAMH